MARVAHRRVLLRLYEDVPQHQEILRWLDGYSGRGLQEILREALRIGLPQCFGAVAPAPAPIQAPAPQRTEPAPQPPVSRPAPQRAEKPAPQRIEEPVSDSPVEPTPPMPEFVPSEKEKPQDAARSALVKLFGE